MKTPTNNVSRDKARDKTFAVCIRAGWRETDPKVARAEAKAFADNLATDYSDALADACATDLAHARSSRVARVAAARHARKALAEVAGIAARAEARARDANTVIECASAMSESLVAMAAHKTISSALDVLSPKIKPSKNEY